MSEKKPLLTIVVQGDEQVTLMQEFVDAGAHAYFDIGTDARPMKDSELELPPGTLGRALASSLGRPPELLANVPQVVGLFTFHEKEVPPNAEEYVQRVGRLTVLGRMAAVSPATRALILHSSGRIMQPQDFLDWTEHRDDAPDACLAVWLLVEPVDRALRTRGLSMAGFPEVEIQTGGAPTDDDIARFTDPLLTAGYQMMIRREVLPEGMEIGEYRVRRGDEVVRLLLPGVPAKPSLWQRLFA